MKSDKENEDSVDNSSDKWNYHDDDIPLDDDVDAHGKYEATLTLVHEPEVCADVVWHNADTQFTRKNFHTIYSTPCAHMHSARI